MTPAASDSEQELFLQPVADAGPDPFTESTAKEPESEPPATRTEQPSPSPTTPSPSEEGIRSISGDTPGLYGGTQNVASCDVDAQIRFLTGNRSKAKAFADTVGIAEDGVPSYLRGLTAVQLRGDTRVTNHGFRDGHATAYQSVLQAGTAVLVDNRGMPRVRCSCGNPLTPPAALKANPSPQGKPWRGYRPTKVVVVTPAPTVITNITIININVNITNNTNVWIERPVGHHKGKDKVVPPPKPTPSHTSPSPTSPSPTSPSPTSPSPTSPSPTSPSPTSSSPTPTSSSPTPSQSCPTVLPPDGRDPTLPPGCPTPPEEQGSSPSGSEEPSPGSDEIPVPEDSTDLPTNGTLPDGTGSQESVTDPASVSPTTTTTTTTTTPSAFNG
ncbi:DUF6777 domain-containing protein [Streptomyces boluensis]|uniref:DUF6777 domain-containing protein n=1 Tax=Streptomyces boluensis TaxID=1775135 RepID=UPI001652ABBA|nr:DUF6777 domain-containing protein [Streptomyces boluensis]